MNIQQKMSFGEGQVVTLLAYICIYDQDKKPCVKKFLPP